MPNLYAEESYECPLCLGVYLLNENRHGTRTTEQGEFKVRATIHPGERQTRHYPGSPPSIERIDDIRVLTECPHSDSEHVHEELVLQFKRDFEAGYIEPHHRR